MMWMLITNPARKRVTQEQGTMSPCFFGNRVSLYSVATLLFGFGQIILIDLADLSILIMLLEQASACVFK